MTPKPMSTQRISFLSRILNTLVPPRCAICGRRLTVGEKVICGRCNLRLPRTYYEKNPYDNPMCKLFWGRFPIERATSLFFYAKGGDVARLIHAMKYRHRPALCREMGRLMASRLSASRFFDGIDCLVPVPLHPDRFRQRGYNQSEQLAAGISQLTGIPLCTTAIQRLYNNTTQTQKSGAERMQIDGQLFGLTPQAATLLAGKHILLTDDVLTTGSTLTACADTLKHLPGLRISILTLAWSK